MLTNLGDKMKELSKSSSVMPGAGKFKGDTAATEFLKRRTNLKR